MTRPPLPEFTALAAPASWQTIDLLSDLHLQAADATFEAWRGHLQRTRADAVFILGDLFEAWLGDDAACLPGFAADCVHVLREAATQRPVFLMRGNRDFLVGDALARTTGLTLLDDPTVLDFNGRRWLLTHGDLLCLSDEAYLRFRMQVRTAVWMQAFLAKPLGEREALARRMREASRAHQSNPMAWADVDEAEASRWLQASGAQALIHGHTHRPADHDLPGGRRHVLSDWDAAARPPRVQVLRLSAQGRAQRLPPD